MHFITEIPYRHPPIKWSQRTDHIKVYIALRDIKDYKIEFKEPDVFHFSGKSDNKVYE